MAETRDQGPKPFVVDIEKATLDTETFRTAIWTGAQFQVTVMNIPVGIRWKKSFPPVPLRCWNFTCRGQN